MSDPGNTSVLEQQMTLFNLVRNSGNHGKQAFLERVFELRNHPEFHKILIYANDLFEPQPVTGQNVKTIVYNTSNKGINWKWIDTKLLIYDVLAAVKIKLPTGNSENIKKVEDAIKGIIGENYTMGSINSVNLENTSWVRVTATATNFLTRFTGSAALREIDFEVSEERYYQVAEKIVQKCENDISFIFDQSGNVKVNNLINMCREIMPVRISKKTIPIIGGSGLTVADIISLLYPLKNDYFGNYASNVFEHNQLYAGLQIWGYISTFTNFMFETSLNFQLPQSYGKATLWTVKNFIQTAIKIYQFSKLSDFLPIFKDKQDLKNLLEQIHAWFLWLRSSEANSSGTQGGNGDASSLLTYIQNFKPKEKSEVLGKLFNDTLANTGQSDINIAGLEKLEDDIMDITQGGWNHSFSEMFMIVSAQFLLEYIQWQDSWVAFNEIFFGVSLLPSEVYYDIKKGEIGILRNFAKDVYTKLENLENIDKSNLKDKFSSFNRIETDLLRLFEFINIAEIGNLSGIKQLIKDIVNAPEYQMLSGQTTQIPKGIQLIQQNPIIGAYLIRFYGVTYQDTMSFINEIDGKLQSNKKIETGLQIIHRLFTAGKRVKTFEKDSSTHGPLGAISHYRNPIGALYSLVNLKVIQNQNGGNIFMLEGLSTASQSLIGSDSSDGGEITLSNMVSFANPTPTRVQIFLELIIPLLQNKLIVSTLASFLPVIAQILSARGFTSPWITRFENVNILHNAAISAGISGIGLFAGMFLEHKTKCTITSNLPLCLSNNFDYLRRLALKYLTSTNSEADDFKQQREDVRDLEKNSIPYGGTVEYLINNIEFIEAMGISPRNVLKKSSSNRLRNLYDIVDFLQKHNLGDNTTLTLRQIIKDGGSTQTNDVHINVQLLFQAQGIDFYPTPNLQVYRNNHQMAVRIYFKSPNYITIHYKNKFEFEILHLNNIFTLKMGYKIVNDVEIEGSILKPLIEMNDVTKYITGEGEYIMKKSWIVWLRALWEQYYAINPIGDATLPIISLSDLRCNPLTYNSVTGAFHVSTQKYVIDFLPPLNFNNSDISAENRDEFNEYESEYNATILKNLGITPYTVLEIDFKESKTTEILQYLFGYYYTGFLKFKAVDNISDLRITAEMFEYVRTLFFILASRVQEDIKVKRFLYINTDWIADNIQNYILSKNVFNEDVLSINSIARKLIDTIPVQYKALIYYCNEIVRVFNGQEGQKGIEIPFNLFIERFVEVDPVVTASLRARFMAKYHPATD